MGMGSKDSPSCLEKRSSCHSLALPAADPPGGSWGDIQGWQSEKPERERGRPGGAMTGEVGSLEQVSHSAKCH